MSALADFGPRDCPGTRPLEGHVVRVEPIVDDRHFDALFAAFAEDSTGGIFDHLPYGPFADRAAFRAWAEATYLADDIRFHAILPSAAGRAEGVAALMRTDTANGVTEIGHICLAPSLQRSRAASEAFYLIMERVFDELGYRRLEWKCDDRNQPSKRAAERLGFVYEGLFRQHMIVKGRNRDTAWYAIVDRDWPRVRSGFEAWLAPDNFDTEGRQRRALAPVRESLAARQQGEAVIIPAPERS
ncbi:MAG TPA: GNAT family protein [Aurantimonas sp.]